jgi:hypothetical protein
MPDYTDKPLTEITEAEALTFIGDLRTALATAQASLVAAQGEEATLQASLATAQAHGPATVPSHLQVILHQPNANRKLTVISSDTETPDTLTVHVS